MEINNEGKKRRADITTTIKQENKVDQESQQLKKSNDFKYIGEYTEMNSVRWGFCFLFFVVVVVVVFYKRDR